MLSEHNEVLEQETQELAVSYQLVFQHEMLVTELEALEELATALVAESERFAEDEEVREAGLE